MNTSINNSSLEKALSNLPKIFQVKILSTYKDIKTRYSQAQFNSSYDALGLSSGKFCETVLRFIQNELTKKYIPFGKNIPNFADECRKLITQPESSGNESLRIIIPRSLIFLITMRGKRGIGHIEGDVEANEIDAETIVRVCDWIICELIRIYHNLPLEEAQFLVDSIAEKKIPDIWEIAGEKRVLRPGLNFTQKVLILLYTETQKGVLVEDLFAWAKHSNLTVFKNKILRPLDQKNHIYFDTELEIAYISPIGIELVENSILKKEK